MFEKVYDIDNLYEAFMKINSVSGYKRSVQVYKMQLIGNLSKLSAKIKNGKYKPKKPDGFFISERGKERYIESRCIDDNIVFYTVHKQIILPAIAPKLIYDNSASLERRGTQHFRKRLPYHLSSFSYNHGTNGYILLMDFMKYFDNIIYDVFLNQLSRDVRDGDCMKFIEMLVYDGAIDVSYMTDEEYANCLRTPFNNLEYRKKVRDGIYKCTGEKLMYKGMSLGSPISQDAGIYVPNRIDTYIKIVRKVKYYARYMDDSYVIHESKEFLEELLCEITEIARQLGIFISPKKTCIIPLTREFSILKNRYRLYPNGSVKIMPNNDTMMRETRKLKKQKELLDYNKIEFDDISTSYLGWRGNILQQSHGNIPKALEHVDNLYEALFL